MKKRARWLGMCALALLLCVQPLMFGACAARGSGSGDLSAAAVTDPPSETEVTPDKYIFYALSDPNKAQLTAQVKALKAVVGNTYESDKYKLAFATDGPRPLDQTVAQMEQEIDEAFEVAIAYDMPVYIKIDDLGYLKDKGNDTAFASDEDLHDTYNFAGDEATLYFNWGTWRYTDYVPAIGTPAYRAFIADKIVDGLAKPILKNIKALREAGKEWLFAGVSSGWESCVFDYRGYGNVTAGHMVPGRPNKTMTEAEKAFAFYKSLVAMTAAEHEADNNVIAVTDAATLRQRANAASFTGTYGVSLPQDSTARDDAFILTYAWRAIQEVQELICKALSETTVSGFDYTLPRTKIFTHIACVQNSYSADKLAINSSKTSAMQPPAWTAVNPYATPGFTMGPAGYNLTQMKAVMQAADPTLKYFGQTEGYATDYRSIDGKTASDTVDYFKGIFEPSGAGDMESLIVSVYGFNDPETSRYWYSKSLSDSFNKAVYHLKYSR